MENRKSKMDVTPVAEIYELIIDIEMAIDLMADKKLQPGRASKGAALAVLAEVYLHMAGYPLNDETKYALAASTAKEVIDNKDKYGFGLLDDYAKLWPTQKPLYQPAGNKEMVFALCNQGTRESGMHILE